MSAPTHEEVTTPRPSTATINDDLRGHLRADQAPLVQRSAEDHRARTLQPVVRVMARARKAF